MGEKDEEIKSTDWQLQNRYGDVKYTIENIVNKIVIISLTGVAQWVGCCSADQKVTGSIMVRVHAWVEGHIPD